MAASRRGPLLFVVQQHAARRLHYDFRLELRGVLKSWAVPNGFPAQRGEKHLAVQTEDHPLDYGPFEGVIPPKQYGAGKVIVWDCGLYSPDGDGSRHFTDREEAQRQIEQGIAKGKLSLHLAGEKLKGSYALVRTKTDWLLLKHTDAVSANAPSSINPSLSVLSGVAVSDIYSHASRFAVAQLAPSEPGETFPKRLAPMLAESRDEPFSHPDWLFEPKLDGYRVLAFIADGQVTLRSRNGLDLTPAFPVIAGQLAQQPVQPMLLDGELIAFQDGKASFDALQTRVQLKTAMAIREAERTVPTAYYCFDVLHAAGVNVRSSRYVDRRRYLAQCLLPRPHVLMTAVEADGMALYRASLAAGFEGMLAKRKESVYQPGQRSASWLKIRALRTGEFVIGGYSRGKGRREALGALLLGQWAGTRLTYMGNAGSGFDEAMIAHLLKELSERQTMGSPFDPEPTGLGKPLWVRPQLVAEVRFSETTSEGRLRQPVFLRLRPDRDARSVTGAQSQALLKSVSPPAGAAELDPEVIAADAAAILVQLKDARAKATLQVHGHALPVTQLDKVLWPAFGRRKALTKRDLLSHLASVAPFMLPLIQDRPMTMIRMPDGIARGERFFQKHWEQTLPPFVETVEAYSGARDKDHRLLLCNNLPTLLWLGQLGTLEFHVTHSSIAPAEGPGGPFTGSRENVESSALNHPDYLAFDIDPYIYSGKEAPGAEPEYHRQGFDKGKEIAFALKEVLDALQLRSFVKTSGKTGLHVFVPIRRTLTFDQARSFAQLVGQHLLRRHPDELSMEWNVSKRTRKVFFDHNMNVRGKTLNAAYSPRAVPGAPVSMPVAWEELARVQPTDFTIARIRKILGRREDPWQGFLSFRQSVEQALNL